MRQAVAFLFGAVAVIFMTACAESLHQGQGVAPHRARWNAGDLEAPSYGQRPGAWWYPFGYYGAGSGWHRGGSSDGGQQSNAPAPRPTPPANAPPQFQKKY
ncbi:MAG: hypothetical protein JNM35_05835 [Nitrospira sp.]|nr:hypothetical protein [Nitrospira sp.]